MKHSYINIFTLLALLLVLVINPLPAIADETQDEIDDLNDRVDALELKTAKNKVSFFGDFRVKYDYLRYEYPRYWQFGGFDDQGMPIFMDVPANELTNGENWSLRLRLKIDAKPSDELHFTGRINVHQTYGGFGVPIFNGFPNTVAFDANSTAIGGDNILRIERAAFTYDPEELPIFLTVGRQAATSGPPRELRENRVRQGTPGALMIDAEIDGVMLGFHLDEIIKGLPAGSIFRFCYGTGYESGFGSGGSISMARTMVMMTASGPVLAELSNLKDSRVVGGCFETSIPAIPGRTLLSGGYFRLLDMTDISPGYTRNFPDPYNGNPQLVTSTNNLGDMDLMGACFQHEYSNLAWFVSVASNKSHPDPGKESAYGFGGLLGNPNASETGFAYFVGGRLNLSVPQIKVGAEYNHGNEHWFSFTSGADDFAMSKLATRGSVIELYLIKKIEKKLDFRVGAQLFSYDYAFSGWHIWPSAMQMPDGSILNGTKLDSQPYMAYAFPEKATNIYAILDLSF